MQLLQKLYKKLRKHRQKDVSSAIRSEVLRHIYQLKALECSGSLISNKKNNIVISLTSQKHRLRNLHLVLDSISRQTIKPYRVALWLSDKLSFEVLPETVKNYMDHGLVVNFVNDLGPHTKLLYSLKSFPEDLIITIDDDIIYPHDLVETLYSNYCNNPRTICCNAARGIEFDKNGILPYGKWNKFSGVYKTGKNLLPLGVNGILYFPDCFNPDVNNTELISKLCPSADDIWFRMMSYLNQISITLTGAYSNPDNDFIAIEDTVENSLAFSNILQHGNEKQMKAILHHYGIKLHME